MTVGTCAYDSAAASEHEQAPCMREAAACNRLCKHISYELPLSFISCFMKVLLTCNKL